MNLIMIDYELDWMIDWRKIIFKNCIKSKDPSRITLFSPPIRSVSCWCTLHGSFLSHLWTAGSTGSAFTTLELSIWSTCGISSALWISFVLPGKCTRWFTIPSTCSFFRSPHTFATQPYFACTMCMHCPDTSQCKPRLNF